jgi:hydrogenase assembly chaperone HypC/HupF
MCLNFPAKIIEAQEGSATVEFLEEKIKVLNPLKAKKGNYVLIQNRIAIEKISEETAKESIKVLVKALKKKKKKKVF